MPSQARALQSVVQGKSPGIVDGVDTLRLPVGLGLGIQTYIREHRAASPRALASLLWCVARNASMTYRLNSDTVSRKVAPSRNTR